MPAHNYPVNKEKETPLKQRRIELGLAQKEIADKAGMSVQQYQKFEVGDRILSNASFMTACKVLKALEIDILEFFEQELERQNTAE